MKVGDVDVDMTKTESLDVPWQFKLRKWLEKSQLVIYTVLLLVSSVGNSLYFKQMTSAMPNYCFFLSSLSTVFYLPIFGMLSGRGIAKHANWPAIQKFAVMGLFDGLAGVFMILGGSHTSGTMQVLLSQGVIPCTLFASIVLLSKKFHLLQHAGAAAIIGGIVLAKLHKSSGGTGGAADVGLFNIIFVIACVPTALSSCFKEVAFRGFDGDLDVNVLQFWVAIFQTFVTFLTMPIYTLSILGTSQVPLDQMSQQSALGARCLFFFENTVVTDCGGLGQRPCDTCEEAYKSVYIYFTFNCLYNIFTMLVIKHGSATLSFLVATLRMPLSSIAFSSKAIMGKDAVQPTLADFISLCVIIGGLSAYRVGGRQLKRQLEEQNESAQSSPSTWLLSDSPARPSPGGTLKRRATDLGWRFVPMIMTGMNAQPVFLFAPEPVLAPRSSEKVRSDLIRRLGAASPLHSPKLRGLSPHGPTERGYPEAYFEQVEPTGSPRSDRKSVSFEEQTLAYDAEHKTSFDMSGLPAQKTQDSIA